MVYTPSTAALRKLSNEELIDALQHAASDNNEFDNREVVTAYRAELLRRLNSRK